ncbi:hypothetical protein ACIRD2_03330 [Streptomyces sp. NPDC093595]|uniref:hypothetical protein n=1 Tax=Streptomyces sp. NPDC093595 TaxID=3366045 RepID=UPI00380224AB
MTRPVQTVTSELLSELPVIPAPVGDLLLRALGLAPRRVPAWITDPDTVASILAGFVDIPDDLYGEAR